MPPRGYPKRSTQVGRRRGGRTAGRLVSFAPTAPPLAGKIETIAPPPPPDPDAVDRALAAERRDRERRAAFAREAERQALAEKKEAERRAAAVRDEERRALLAQVIRAPKEDRERLLEEARLVARGRDLAARLKRAACPHVDRAWVAEVFGISIED